MAMHARMLLGEPNELVQRVVARLSRQRGFRRGASAPAKPIRLFRPRGADTAHLPAVPAQFPGIRVTSSWDEVVEAVSREQGDHSVLQVKVYGCASMQWLG